MTALEVIEHVDNQPVFCGSLAALAADWGAVLVSTLSRTPQVFRVWPCRGTHKKSWTKAQGANVNPQPHLSGQQGDWRLG